MSIRDPHGLSCEGRGDNERGHRVGPPPPKRKIECESHKVDPGERCGGERQNAVASKRRARESRGDDQLLASEPGQEQERQRRHQDRKDGLLGVSSGHKGAQRPGSD